MCLGVVSSPPVARCVLMQYMCTYSCAVVAFSLLCLFNPLNLFSVHLRLPLKCCWSWRSSGIL